MSNVDEARKRVFIELHGRLARAVIDAGEAIPGEQQGLLRVDPYLAATNAMRVLPKVVFFDDALRLRLRQRFGAFIAAELLAVLGGHTDPPNAFGGTLNGPSAGAANAALEVFDNEAHGPDWVERAIGDGILSRKRTLIGLCKDDVDCLTRSQYANCSLLVRFRSATADGRMVMTANDVVALSQSNSPFLIGPSFAYNEIRDIFPLRDVEDSVPQAQVV